MSKIILRCKSCVAISAFQLLVKRSAAAGTKERIDRALTTSFTTGSASSAGRLTTDFPPPRGRGKVHGQPWKSMWTAPYRQHPFEGQQIDSGFPRLLFLPERKIVFLFPQDSERFCSRFFQDRRCDPVRSAAELKLSGKRNRAEIVTPICSELHSIFVVWSALLHRSFLIKNEPLGMLQSGKNKRNYPSANGATGGPIWPPFHRSN